MRHYPGVVDSRRKARMMCNWMNNLTRKKEYVVRRVQIEGRRGPGSYTITTTVVELPSDIKHYDKERSERPERAEISRIEERMKNRGNP
jgi:hypothetical protein